MPPRLTVAVCTYNPDVGRLERTLAGLDAQTLPRDEWELFIVDNRSARSVAELEPVRRRGTRVVREEQPGLMHARECAAREALAEVVVFPDDDTVLAPGYLAAALDLMSDHSIGMLSGHVEPEYEVQPPPWFGRFEGSLAIRRVDGDGPFFADPARYSERFPIGAGCVVRTAILRDHAASLSSAGRIEGRTGTELLAGEDLDMALFAAERGYRIGVSGRLRLRHLIPAVRLTEEYMGRLLVGATRSNAALERKWTRDPAKPLFPYLRQPQFAVRLKLLLYRLLSFKPEFRIRGRVQRELVRAIRDGA